MKNNKTLREQLLEATDDFGNIKITPRLYYDKYITKELGGDSFRYSNLVRCCFHDDSSASLGTFISDEGHQIFRCFGCKTSGDVIKMHFLWLREKGIYMTMENALLDLAEKEGIVLDKQQAQESLLDIIKGGLIDIKNIRDMTPYQLTTQLENIKNNDRLGIEDKSKLIGGVISTWKKQRLKV